MAFQQIISKGKVEQEELRGSLAEALPGALQIAARAFGVTTQALGDMVTKGLDAATFTRAFTQQLTREMPQGAAGVDTAAQAFARLGNEILLLKDRIAQSGLLKFLADAAAGVAGLLKAGREGEEQAARATRARASQATGGTQLLPGDAEKLLKVTEQLTRAEDELRGLQVARQQGAFGPLTGMIATDAQLAAAQKTVDTLRTQQTQLVAIGKLRERAQAGVTARGDLEGGDRLTEMRAAEQAAAEANQKLADALKGTGQSLDTLTQKAKETPVVFGNLTGTAEAKITLLDNRIKILRENLEKVTETITGRTAPGAVPPELTQQKAAFEQQLVQAERQKQAIQDSVAAAETAQRAATSAREKAARDAESARERAARQEAQDAEHAQSAVDQVAASLARQREQAEATLDSAGRRLHQDQRSTGCRYRQRHRVDVCRG